MAVEKLSVSFEPKLAKLIRKAALGAGLSLSAWLADAADRQLLVEEGRRALAEWESEHGEISRRELDEVAAKWTA